MAISFKNVGKLKSERLIERSESPIGIKTPIRTDSRFGLFSMTTRPLDQIQDNLKNLVLTNYGERVMMPDFGADLKSVIFEMDISDAEEVLAGNIHGTVSKYMPFVSLDELVVSFGIIAEYDEVATANVKITYSVPSISDKTLTLELAVTQ
jgi:phage baseplate assembly protein W